MFAFAPFTGAGRNVVLGDRSGSWVMTVGGILMLLSVALHLMESHGHSYRHERLTHDHAHTHGDGHHDHVHSDFTTGSHSQGWQGSQGPFDAEHLHRKCSTRADDRVPF